MTVGAREQAVVFDCAGERLVGIATVPAMPVDTGVLILVGGRQYRAGSHRQFVLLARRLASADFSVFRFDFRGMGDSGGERRGFDDVDVDIAAALAAFREACPSVQRVVLWGLCDAATAAVLYWQRTRDPLVAGLCLANPWLRSETSLARTRVRHYYGDRALAPQFWRKLLGGGIHPLHALRGYLRDWREARRPAPAGFQQVMLDGLRAFPGPVQVLLSGRDLTAREFEDALSAAGMGEIFGRGNVCRTDITESDHTFSRLPWQAEVEQAVVGWLSERFLARAEHWR